VFSVGVALWDLDAHFPPAPLMGLGVLWSWLALPTGQHVLLPATSYPSPLAQLEVTDGWAARLMELPYSRVGPLSRTCTLCAQSVYSCNVPTALSPPPVSA
jgi:hypothetical protein